MVRGWCMGGGTLSSTSTPRVVIRMYRGTEQLLLGGLRVLRSGWGGCGGTQQ